MGSTDDCCIVDIVETAPVRSIRSNFLLTLGDAALGANAEADARHKKETATENFILLFLFVRTKLLLLQLLLTKIISIFNVGYESYLFTSCLSIISNEKL